MLTESKYQVPPKSTIVTRASQPSCLVLAGATFQVPGALPHPGSAIRRRFPTDTCTRRLLELSIAFITFYFTF